MFYDPMKIKNLEVYGIPAYILDIWEENYSSYLMPVQEKAVKYYGVLDDDGSRKANDHLMVVSPTSSGKTFIGEMAAIYQTIHHKKTVYLVPLRTLAEEKYRRFKKMYQPCGIEVLISSRDRKEDDIRIASGKFDIAIMIYEKFHYFLLKYPAFLNGVSLVVVDEMQVINDPARGPPLLEEILTRLQEREQRVRVIALSAFMENQREFLAWFPCRLLGSYRRPVELRKGIVRKGIFTYITYNEREAGEEVFFPPSSVRDNSRKDYILETVRYFAQHHEPTLLFFPTRRECKRWAQWLADRLQGPPAEKALEELKHMEETLTRDSLLALLEKGIAYHNSDLSWEERNLVENYLQNGEIQVVCATTTLAMGVNLPFKNVILSVDKVESATGDYQDARLASLTFTDIENMGGRAGRFDNRKKEAETGAETEEAFGRVIFLAHSRLSETIYQNLYFNFLQDRMEKERTADYVAKRQDEGRAQEEIIPYPETENANRSGRPTDRMAGIIGVVEAAGAIDTNETAETAKTPPAAATTGPIKKEKDVTTLLLRLIAGGRKNMAENHHGYWQFVIDKKGSKERVASALKYLKENGLIVEDQDKEGQFSATDAGTLVAARGIKTDTYLYFLSWLTESVQERSAYLRSSLFSP